VIAPLARAPAAPASPHAGPYAAPYASPNAGPIAASTATSNAAPNAAPGSGAPDDAKLWEAAHKFEAMTLNQLLAPMFATIDLSGSPFGGGKGEAQWAPMLTEAIAKQMAARGGLGLAAPVHAEMLRLQEQGGGQPRRMTR
jgi:flagellar protein FlgJ